MTTVNLGYQSADTHGRATFDVMDDYAQKFLLAGAEPALQPAAPVLLADSLDLAQFTVVGLNSSGKLVKAAYNATEASGIAPIGVLAHAAVSGSSNTTIYGQVWRFGCFNADADSPLVWDSTFDTLAKKTEWVGVLRNSNLIFRSRSIPA